MLVALGSKLKLTGAKPRVLWPLPSGAWWLSRDSCQALWGTRIQRVPCVVVGGDLGSNFWLRLMVETTLGSSRKSPSAVFYYGSNLSAHRGPRPSVMRFWQSLPLGAWAGSAVPSGVGTPETSATQITAVKWPSSFFTLGCYRVVKVNGECLPPSFVMVPSRNSDQSSSEKLGSSFLLALVFEFEVCSNFGRAVGLSSK